MENRYALLLKPGAHYDSDDEENCRSQDYASFLLEKERKCTRDFFVDSKRLQKAFAAKQEYKNRNSKGRKQQYLTVVDLMAKKRQDEKEYDRRLKIIEDHMWQYKQQERELKRLEGDIIKNQREVRRSLRDYENAITRKRLAEEKKINQGQQKYTDLQRQFLHKKEDLTKQRIEAKLSLDQTHKDMGRKVLLTTNHLAKKYRDKRDELEMKRNEVNRLSREYEQKILEKEEEQYRLKQELAELAITLNMEAQKGRTQEINFDKEKKKELHKFEEEEKTVKEDLDTKLARSDNDAKAAEQVRRKLSADLSLTRAHLQLKQREEERHKKDTDNRLRDNNLIQKQLTEAQQQAEMERQNRQINQRIQEHNQRRHLLTSQAYYSRKENAIQHEQQFSERAKKRSLEQLRREHEDHLKHFQKEVTKGEDIEYNLYNRVKNAEYKRQKQEQALRRLHSELEEIKRQNAAAIKNQLVEAAQKEEELKQKLIKEQAQLAKVHAEREECYMNLQKHRQQLRQDKYLLTEHEREHQRLMRLAMKSEEISSS